MKIKPNLNFFIYALVVLLALATLALVAASPDQFSNTKVVYQGF